MSNDITLSDELIDNLYGVICQHDESAKQNMMVALQYFAAVSGYMLGDYPGSDDEREELIDQLADFTKHVSGDRVKSQKAQEQSEPEAPAVAGWIQGDRDEEGVRCRNGCKRFAAVAGGDKSGEAGRCDSSWPG